MLILDLLFNDSFEKNMFKILCFNIATGLQLGVSNELIDLVSPCS